MKKITINHIASSGIIYKESDPSKIFLEIKDKTYPIKQFRHALCPIGGNWIGEAAKKDRGPKETFNREVEEELSFKKPLVSSSELKLLGIKNAKDYRLNKLKHQPNKEDLKALLHVKRVIKKSKKPWGDFLHTVNQDKISLANFFNHQDRKFTHLISYYFVPIKNKDWEILENLQNKFGNLSEESQTIIVSVNNIIKNHLQFIWGHDQVLKQFFLKNKIKSASKLSILKNIQSKAAGRSLNSYTAYRKRYNVFKTPFGNKV